MRSFWVHHGTCIVKWDKGHEGWLCWSGFPWGLRPEEKISVWSQPRDFSPHSANPGGPWIVPRQWWQCRTRGVVEPIKSWQAEIDSSFQATLQPPTFSNSTLPTVFISPQVFVSCLPCTWSELVYHCICLISELVVDWSWACTHSWQMSRNSREAGMSCTSSVHFPKVFGRHASLSGHLILWFVSKPCNQTANRKN